MTADEKRHVSRVVALGCVLCRINGYQDTPAEAHHPRTGVGAGQKASHYDVIALCPHHHRLGNDALHVMGRRAFERRHGVTELELLEMTRRLLA